MAAGCCESAGSVTVPREVAVAVLPLWPDGVVWFWIVGTDWLKGMPGVFDRAVVLLPDVPLTAAEEATSAPLLSIMLTRAAVMPAGPLLAAKDMVAIRPLPEKGVLLMMAIFIDPGRVVFAANMAPDTRLP